MTEWVPDISHYQTGLDVTRLGGMGAAGVIAKASEGVGSIDGGFSWNIQAAHKTQLLAGAYHFARPSESSGSYQADIFAHLCNSEGVQLAALDIETTGGLGSSELMRWCADFLGTLRANHSGGVASYCSQSYASQMESVLFANGIGRWIASPGYTPYVKYDLWQSNWYGSMLGIHPVDVNTWPGDRASLAQWFGVTALPVTGSPIPLPIPQPAPKPTPAPTPAPKPTPKETHAMLITYQGQVLLWNYGSGKGSVTALTNPKIIHDLADHGMRWIQPADPEHHDYVASLASILKGA